jgi:branched-chain amino acid aminotransferase
MIVYLNGAWLPAAQAGIPVDDRGFLFGDGIYETVRLHRGGFFRLAEHLERFAAGAALLRIAAPPAAELGRLASEIVRRNDLSEGMLRITLTRGSGGRGLGTAAARTPLLLLTIAGMPADWDEPARRGWALITAAIRRPPAETLPPQLKGQGRMYAILARLEAEDAGADDALLLSAEGDVAEGPAWNVFWRVGTDLFTPSLEVGVLAGVTRSRILELAPDSGFHVHEGRWRRDVLDRADEIFATMSSQGVVPINRLDGRELPLADASAAARLRPRYWDSVAREIQPLD